MYHVRRAEEIAFEAPAAYAPHSSGHRRAPIVTRAVGAVHTGITQCALDPGGTVGEHLHSFEKSFYVLEGRPRLTLDGRTWQLSPDDCGLVPLGVPHAWRAADDSQEPCRWIEASAPVKNVSGEGWPSGRGVGALASIQRHGSWLSSAARHACGTPSGTSPQSSGLSCHVRPSSVRRGRPSRT